MKPTGIRFEEIIKVTIFTGITKTFVTGKLIVVINLVRKTSKKVKKNKNKKTKKLNKRKN